MKKPRKHEQRLLKNMGAHQVVLDLLKIPYDTVSVVVFCLSCCVVIQRMCVCVCPCVCLCEMSECTQCLVLHPPSFGILSVLFMFFILKFQCTLPEIWVALPG